MLKLTLRCPLQQLLLLKLSLALTSCDCFQNLPFLIIVLVWLFWDTVLHPVSIKWE